MFTLHGRHPNFRYCTAIDVPFRTFCNSSTASCAALCSLRWSMGKVRGQLSNQPDVSSARNPREVKISFWVSNDWKWWDVFLVGIHAVPCLAHFLFKNYNYTYSKQTCTCERNKLIKYGTIIVCDSGQVMPDGCVAMFCKSEKVLPSWTYSDGICWIYWGPRGWMVTCHIISQLFGWRCPNPFPTRRSSLLAK